MSRGFVSGGGGGEGVMVLDEIDTCIKPLSQIRWPYAPERLRAQKIH